MLKRSLLVLLVTVVADATAPAAVLAQSTGGWYADDELGVAEDGDQAAQPPGDTQRRRTESTYRGYRSHGQILREWCGFLEQDGRRELLLNLATEPPVPPPADCLACSDLLRAIARSCRIRVARPRAGLATPTPLPRQREPSLNVLSAASRFAAQLAAQDDRSEHFSAIEYWLSLLRDPAGKEPGARDYYAFLAAALSRPFDEYRRAQGIRKSPAGPVAATTTATEPAVDLDELFDF